MDTNAYTAFKCGDHGAIEIVRYADRIGINTIVLGELLAGFDVGTLTGQNRRELNAFLDSPRVDVLVVGEGTADYYATIFSALKRKGRPIPTNDLWIAASALEHGYSLYSFANHFKNIDGLPTGIRMDDFLP